VDLGLEDIAPDGQLLNPRPFANRGDAYVASLTGLLARAAEELP
jgi:hypothetical protein